jgi:hypothetical protein
MCSIGIGSSTIFLNIEYVKVCVVLSWYGAEPEIRGLFQPW